MEIEINLGLYLNIYSKAISMWMDGRKEAWFLRVPLRSYRIGQSRQVVFTISKCHSHRLTHLHLAETIIRRFP